MSGFSGGITTGLWTPIDGSGAGLTFTSVSGGWTQIFNIVFAYGVLTYPSTVDASAAKIGGLPVTVANANYAQQGLISYTSITTAAKLSAAKNTTSCNILTATAGTVTNATMSLGTISFMCIYPVV